jgi:hypothetical protein
LHPAKNKSDKVPAVRNTDLRLSIGNHPLKLPRRLDIDRIVQKRDTRDQQPHASLKMHLSPKNFVAALFLLIAAAPSSGAMGESW